jgi:hypothetical protein
MEMSTEKTKTLAFQRKEPIPGKGCIDNRILERVNKFRYLDYALSYQGEVDVSTKTSKYTKTIGIINMYLNYRWYTDAHLCLYKTSAD